MPGKKGEKAPDPPKKPMAAFFLYKSARYSEFVKLHPDKKVSDLTKIISEQWNKESQEVKDKYQKEYNVLKEKYKEDLKAYEVEYGKPEKKKKKAKKDKGEKKAKGKKEKKSVKKEKAPAEAEEPKDQKIEVQHN